MNRQWRRDIASVATYPLRRIANDFIERNIPGTNPFLFTGPRPMPPHTRSGRRYGTPATTPRTPRLRVGPYNGSNSNPSDVRHQTANNATDLLDQYHPQATLKGKATKHRKSKRAKKAAKKKRAFKKKVEKIIHKLDAPIMLVEWSGGTNLTNSNSVWVTTPRQQLTYSPGNYAFKMWLGGAAPAGAPLSQRYDIQRFADMLKQVNTDMYGSGDGALLSAAGGYVKGINALKPQFWITKYEFNLSLANLINTAGVISTPTSPITYDILEYVAARNMPPGDNYNTVQNATTQLLSEISSLGANFGVAGTTTITALSNLGQTPSTLPGMSKHWKLEQSTRIFLQPGESTCLTIHGPTGWYDQQKYSDMTSIKGKTKEIVIISAAGIGYGLTNAVSPGIWTVTKTIKARFPSEFGLSPLIPLSMAVNI